MSPANDNVLSEPSLKDTQASLEFAILAMHAAIAGCPKSSNLPMLDQKAHLRGTAR